MEARYQTNEEGERVAVVVDLEEFRRVLEAHRAVYEAVDAIQRSMQQLSAQELSARDRVEEVQAEAQAALEQARDRAEEASRRVYEAQRTFANVREELEDEEASAALERDVAEIERGEVELIPLREAMPGIARERDELRRRGEL